MTTQPQQAPSAQHEPPVRGLATAERAAVLVLALVVATVAWVTTNSTTSGGVVSFEHIPAGAHQSEPYRLLVDVNHDPWQRMTLVPGIGEQTAKRIVAHREQHGPFTTLDELLEVHGIGTRRLEQWRPHIRPIKPQPTPNQQVRDQPEPD